MAKQLPPIDDDIYEYLQAEAVPLEDDHNSVLRRLLGLTRDSEKLVPNNLSGAGKTTGSRAKRRASKRSKHTGRTRAPKGSILPEQEYEVPILRALEELGGRAATTEVIDRVGKLLDGQLTGKDREGLSSGDVRWRNRAQFVRLALIKKGDMKDNSPRGVWEISGQGQTRLKEANG